MMAPDAKAEEADAADGADHRAVAEYRLARKRGEQVLGDAHSGEDRDIHFGMAEKPEQVLPQKRRTALVPSDDLVRDHESAGNKEACARNAIEQEKNARREEHAERQQAKNRRDEPCPHSQGQAHHGHAFGPQIQHCGDEIQRTHQRGDAENRNAGDPQIRT